MNTPTGRRPTAACSSRTRCKSDVRLSGTAGADLAAALGGPAEQPERRRSSTTAPATQVSKTSDGVDAGRHRHVLGRDGTAGDPCAGKALGAACTPTGDDRARSRTPATSRPGQAASTDVTQWRVTRGILDSRNRNSLWYADAIAGRRRASSTATGSRRSRPSTLQGRPPDRRSSSAAPTRAWPRDRQPEQRGRSRSTRGRARSRCRSSAARRAERGAARSPTRPGTVGGTVPATLALTLGAPATFGAFTPGIAKEYTAAHDGQRHLHGGRRDAERRRSEHDQHRPAGQRRVRPGRSRCRASSSPRRWTGPVLQRDGARSRSSSSIAANDPLRTGTYSKTLTFTLSTTTP